MAILRGAPYSVKYQNLTAILSKAVQEIAQRLDALGQQINSLASQINGLANTVANFAQSFTTKELTATNITADSGTFTHLNADELCVKDSTGAPVCVTGDQLKLLLSGSALSGSVLGASTQHQSEPAAGAPTAASGETAGAPGGPSAQGGSSADTTSTTTPVSDASSSPEVAQPANDNPQPQGAEQSSHDGNAPAASTTPPAANDNPLPLPPTGTSTDASSTAQ